MVTCDTVRDELAVDLATNDAAVQKHMEHCTACAAYYRRHAALDGVVRTEMRWEAPVDLTARLLAMASTIEVPQLVVPVRPQPKRWHVVLAYAVATLSVMLSLLVGWQIFSLLASQPEIQVFIAQVSTLPGQLLAQLTQSLPESRYVVDFFFRIRAQLMWLLLAAVLWAMLDKWNPSFNFRRRQQTS
jgi:anti-sigma factor RsiW